MSAVIPQLERLHIEVTNVCNFKCEFCPDGIMQRRRGHMEPALLEQILEEVAATGLARVMAFHLMGEPLLYPYLFEGIRRAAELGLRLHLTSNGSTFALWPEHIEQLNRSPFAKLTISLQTPDPVTFSIRGAPPPPHAGALLCWDYPISAGALALLQPYAGASQIPGY
jgi:MoaA/NifB/PqqE/SkfB family radical SAM enzyme